MYVLNLKSQALEGAAEKREDSSLAGLPSKVWGCVRKSHSEVRPSCEAASTEAGADAANHVVSLHLVFS